MEKKIVIGSREYPFNGSIWEVMKTAEAQSLYTDLYYRIFIDEKCIVIFYHGREVIHNG